MVTSGLGTVRVDATGVPPNPVPVTCEGGEGLTDGRAVVGLGATQAATGLRAGLRRTSLR
ncbi:hypothetical protein Pme01_21480 [Planosporangium mesophilum]|uniref:Uncharacterized protein n=1 Tax=Planosporangium mesophilum TaxID=689768 RepID=A0A8J3X0D3_9ACTN|nr:hypothetical protein Pme01_21480 [Planosporangium mesophilum]